MTSSSSAPQRRLTPPRFLFGASSCLPKRMRQGSSKELLALGSARSHTYTHIYARDCSKGRHSKPEDGLFCAPFSAMLLTLFTRVIALRPDCQHPFVWHLVTNCSHSRPRLCSLVRRFSQTRDHPMETATRSIASRQIEDAMLNYTEVSRLQPWRGHGGCSE